MSFVSGYGNEIAVMAQYFRLLKPYIYKIYVNGIIGGNE